MHPHLITLVAGIVTGSPSMAHAVHLAKALAEVPLATVVSGLARSGTGASEHRDAYTRYAANARTNIRRLQNHGFASLARNAGVFARADWCAARSAIAAFLRSRDPVTSADAWAASDILEGREPFNCYLYDQGLMFTASRGLARRWGHTPAIPSAPRVSWINAGTFVLRPADIANVFVHEAIHSWHPRWSEASVKARADYDTGMDILTGP